jgi:hypothetical protein
MKKQLLYITLGLSLSAATYFRPSSDKSITSFKNNIERLNILKFKSFNTKPESTVTNKLKLNILNIEQNNNVPDITELEHDFEKLSNIEIKKEIDKNNALVISNKYIEKANKGELDQISAEGLLKTIRTNSVLHKILLDRQLDELESENS